MLLATAEAVGGIAGVLDVTVDYLNTRSTFGRKIGSYQALKHACADILVSHFAVAHRPFRKSHIFAAGMNKAIGILAHQHVVSGGVGALYRIKLVFFGVWIIAPPITDNQYIRLIFQYHVFFCH